MRNKKGQELWYTVGAIAILITIVAFGLVYSGFIREAGGKITDLKCTLSGITSCYGKTPILGTETFKRNCELQVITIKMSDLEAGAIAAKREIDKFNAKFPEQSYILPEDERDLERYYREWALNNYVANYIRIGWGNLGGGDIECLFSNWWWFFGCEEEDLEGNKQECDSFTDRLKLWNWGIHRPPRFCQPMVSLIFDEEVQNEFKGKEITSLKEWMQKNPVPGKTYSYYENLHDDDLADSALYERNYIYSTDEAITITYTRINVHMLEKAAASVGLATEWTLETLTGWDPNVIGKRENIDAMMIIPWSDLKEYCVV